MSISFVLISVLVTIITGLSIGVGIKLYINNSRFIYYLVTPIIALCLLVVMPIMVFKISYKMIGDITQEAINSILKEHFQMNEVPYKKVSHFFRFRMASIVTIVFFRDIPKVLDSLIKKLPRNNEVRSVSFVTSVGSTLEVISKILMSTSEKEQLNVLKRMM